MPCCVLYRRRPQCCSCGSIGVLIVLLGHLGKQSLDGYWLLGRKRLGNDKDGQQQRDEGDAHVKEHDRENRACVGIKGSTQSWSDIMKSFPFAQVMIVETKQVSDASKPRSDKGAAETQ